MEGLSLCVLLCATISLVAGQYYYDCSEESVNRCLGDMMKIAQQSQQGQIPSYTPEEFRNVCREFNEAETCLNQIKSMCSQREKAELEAATILFDYLCGDGFDIYINNSACFFNKKLEADMHICLETYTVKGKQLIYGGGSAEVRLRKLCKYTNDYVGCAGDYTEDLCGEDAAELVIESARRVFNVMFKQQSSFKCTISAAAGIMFSYTSLLISCLLMLRNYF